MVIFKKIKDVKNYILHQRVNNKKIGFIPTMGALHKGHISLVEKAKLNDCLSVCSIFLNPTQFNNRRDFEKYPISKENDIDLLVTCGCDVLFMPDEDEIYPNKTKSLKKFDFGYLESILEGIKRPGHYNGVGQVVSILLDIIEPDFLFLGQKDYQQCLVIKELIKQMAWLELSDSYIHKITTIVCPTIREQDGLAMSSRNRRLTESQRTVAATIYQCLVSIQTKASYSSFEVVKKECEDLLVSKGLIPEYVALADAANLSLLTEYAPKTTLIALIAAQIGEIRLIDNIILEG